MRRLENKLAVVTGGARGIGEAIAAAFRVEGAQVLITDIDVEAGTKTAERLGVEFSKLDVRVESDWEGVFGRLPRLDVLVNNAGITGFESGWVKHDPEHASLKDWHAVHRTNLDGVFLGCKYAITA